MLERKWMNRKICVICFWKKIQIIAAYVQHTVAEGTCKGKIEVDALLHNEISWRIRK
jgi:hypothetical protein